MDDRIKQWLQMSREELDELDDIRRDLVEELPDDMREARAAVVSFQSDLIFLSWNLRANAWYQLY